MTYGPPYLKDIAKGIAWLAIGITALACIPSLADAHPLHRGHYHAHHHGVRTHGHRHPVRVADPGAEHHWWSSGGSSLVEEARSQLGNGAIYGRATLWCARFVNYTLKMTGHSGTGSDMASSFAHYGTRVSGPQVGAIAVMARRGGGHVGIVSGVDAAGDPVIISGNHNRRVREAVYPRSRVYAYVMPN